MQDTSNTLVVRHNNFSDWGTIQYEGNEFSYHVPTGHVYNTDYNITLRTKFVFLTLGSPLVNVVRALDWGIVKPITYLFKPILRRDPQNPNQFINPTKIEVFKDILQSVGDGVKALICAALLTCVAVMGIILPKTGRYFYGMIEKDLVKNQKNNCDYRDNCLASCMQPLKTVSLIDLGLWAHNHNPNHDNDVSESFSFLCYHSTKMTLNVAQNSLVPDIWVDRITQSRRENNETSRKNHEFPTGDSGVVEVVDYNGYLISGLVYKLRNYAAAMETIEVC